MTAVSTQVPIMEAFPMLRSEGILFLGFLVLAGVWWGVTRESEVAIHSIVANPANFDGQDVTLVGSVADLDETISYAGNNYTTFRLTDGSGDSLKIFLWGHPDLTDGEHIRVTGAFETEHHAGRYTFYNEVEASSVAPSQ